MSTKEIVLVSRPKGLPILENFETRNVEIPELADKEILLQAMYFSVDPYMRGRMNDAKSYPTF